MVNTRADVFLPDRKLLSVITGFTELFLLVGMDGQPVFFALSLKSIMNYSGRHILVIQPLVGIGDMIWHKPWIDVLAAQTRVTLATKPTVRADILFHGTENGFSVLAIERSLRGRKGRHDGLSGFFRLIREFRTTGADTAIILHHSARYALAARMAGIKTRLGYGMGRQRRHLNAGQPLLPEQTGGHALDRISQFAHANGFGLDRPQWKINISSEADQAARKWLQAHEFLDEKNTVLPFLVIGIGAMHTERQWGADNFARLTEILSTRRPDLRLMMIGGPAEEALALEINSRLAEHKRSLPFNSDRLDIAAALMAASRGYVGNDTGFLNIMACLGTPALGLYSQSKPLGYTPNLKKLDLFSDSDYGTAGLIRRITPEAVSTAINQIWPKMRQ